MTTPKPIDTEHLNCYLYEHGSADGTYIRITIAADLKAIKKAQAWLEKTAKYMEEVSAFMTTPQKEMRDANNI